ncbi:MAG: Tfp pilus assembly protein PilF [bacterium]|jgi:Tfp pilus assembly protein PilF
MLDGKTYYYLPYRRYIALYIMRKLLVLLCFMPFVSVAQTADGSMDAANLKMKEGNTLGAIKDYTSALAIDGNLVDAYYGRGSVYAELLTYDLALADFNKAIGLDSNMAIAIFNRGVVFSAKGYHKLALSDFDKYVNMRPMDPQGYLARAEYYKKHGHEALANQDYNKVVRLEPVDADGFVSRSEVKLILGDTAGAINDISKCIEAKPEFTQAYLFRAQLYSNTGQTTQAIDDLDLVILNDPRNVKALTTRAMLYNENGVVQAANEDFRRALAIDNKLPEIWFELGYNLLESKSFDEAIMAFQNSLITGVTDTELAYYNKGVAEFNSKRKDEACKSMQRAGSMGAEHLATYCN